MDNEYEDFSLSEDEALIRIDEENLTNYISSLAHYIETKDHESLVFSVSNSIELIDSLEKIKDSYTDESVKLLEQIANLIPKVKDLISDYTLKALLLENLKKIREYFSRIGHSYKPIEKNEYLQLMLDRYYKQRSPELSKIARQMIKNKKDVREETSEDWATLANSIKDWHESKEDEPRPDLDTFLTEGIKRFQERYKDDIALSQQLRKNREVALSNNPAYKMRERLKELAGRILEEA